MITCPVGLSSGSTVTWYAVVPTNLRLRAVESMGRILLVSPISLAVSLTEETFSVLSSRFQVVPPLVEIRKPTPGASDPPRRC